MKGRVAFALSATAVVIAVCLAPLSLSGSARRASAACGGSVGEPDALFSFQPPQTDDFQVTGPAPLTVSATWLLDLLTAEGSTASLNWGDGSAPAPFRTQDCGDETINWPVQTHTHTYATPGTYNVVWSFSIIVGSYDIPVARVNALAAQKPTVAPTAAPTATAPAVTAAPTLSAATATATPIPAGTPAVQTVAPAATVETPLAQTPTATSTATAAATASPIATATATATPTAVVAAVATAVAPSPPPSSPEPDLPETLSGAPRIGDISTDGATLATNLALAGVTIWVLFSSVLLNQILQDNRGEIDARTARLSRPFRRMSGATGGLVRGWGPAVTTVLVLLVTGLVYEFLNPGFGPNRASLLLFLSAILGVGIVTFVCSGLEAAVTRRAHGLAASVRPYPAAMVLAGASVLLSRLMHLQPGVVYGFVASAAITGPGQIDRRRQGAVTIFPVVAALALSVVALVIVEPFRANEGAAASFLGQLVIGAGIIIFIGGIEGVALNMVPLAVTDGGKLFAWRKPVWAAVALVAAFLAWHVLLNRDRQSFDALRQASTLSILVVFAFYSLLTVGLWLYFRGRGEAVAGPVDPVTVTP